MSFNIFKPGFAVRDSLEHPNLAKALLPVIVLSLLTIGSAILIGLRLDLFQQGALLARNIGELVFTAVAFYLVAYLFEGKKIEGKFTGIVSAISLKWVLLIILWFIGFIAFSALISPELSTAMVDTINSGNAEGIEEVSSLLSSSISDSIIPLVLGLLILTFGLYLWGLYIYYKIVSELIEGSVLKRLAALAIVVFLVLAVYII